MFYPKTLSSGWYRRDVSFMIRRSLRGCSNWFGPSIENIVNRTAYYDAFRECLEICKKHEFSPQKMIEGLNLFKWSLQYETPPWVFSRERWTSNKLEYRNKAVDQVIELVASFNARYLSHD